MSLGSEGQQDVLQRFVAACEEDERVVAAFLGGSLATGRDDEWSDLDIYVITGDEAFEDFLGDRRTFIRRLGEPLFLEDFDNPHTLFFVLAGGIEGELWAARESRFLEMHYGPYKVLLDKTGILDGVAFLGRQPAQEVQVETLRRQIYWFWHDLSHFTVAMGRGQLWWAQGQLEALRGYCVNLARLRDDPADPDIGREPYFKVENAIPAGDLGPLQATFGPIERRVLLQSALGVIDFYRELASQLTERHGISYPAELERVMLARLQRLG